MQLMTSSRAQERVLRIEHTIGTATFERTEVRVQRIDAVCSQDRSLRGATRPPVFPARGAGGDPGSAGSLPRAPSRALLAVPELHAPPRISGEQILIPRARRSAVANRSIHRALSLASTRARWRACIGFSTTR